MTFRLSGIVFFLVLLFTLACFHEPGKSVDRFQNLTLWQDRIQTILDKDEIPIIDLESTLPGELVETEFPDFLTTMDTLNIALIAFDGAQRPRTSDSETGYRWSDHIDQLVEDYPAYFLPTTNGGASNNWTEQKSSYIDQLERKATSGPYVMLGEVEFRHYMSNAQCLSGRTDRDEYVPMNSANGHRLFQLAADTGFPLSIHFDMEDDLISELEEMLRLYRSAKVIVAHFGQVRHPESQTEYSATLITELLDSHPNLFFDLSTGSPGRTYPCNNDVLDTVIWQDDGSGGQLDTLKAEYLSILESYSERFVAAADYGRNRNPLAVHYTARVANFELIIRDLSSEAQHNISYRNAWRLITGQTWE